MQAFLQILHEQYRNNDGWQTRECYPWEYDTKIQECIQLASHSGNNEWFLQQAKILQDRAEYIRQTWATQQATQQATLQSTQLATHQSTQQSTPPAPERQSAQPITKPIAQEEKEQEKEQPLHQATVEDIAEDIAESTTEKETEQHDMANSKPDSDSTLSTIPRLCTKPFSGDPAACLSNALHLACQHFLAWHGFLLGYIEYSEGMEATGQG